MKTRKIVFIGWFFIIILLFVTANSWQQNNTTSDDTTLFPLKDRNMENIFQGSLSLPYFQKNSPNFFIPLPLYSCWPEYNIPAWWHVSERLWRRYAARCRGSRCCASVRNALPPRGIVLLTKRFISVLVWFPRSFGDPPFKFLFYYGPKES